MTTYILTVNDQERTVSVDADTPLLWVLRDVLGLTGTKFGCGKGLCGSCTVLVNGKSVRSCNLTIADASEKEVITIEGLSETGDHPIQEAWKVMDVPQCGYCQTGFMMSTVDLLSENPNPTETEIHQALMGNMCRCGTYPRIAKAIQLAINTQNP